MSEDQASGALQLAAQVNFRLDKGQASADAYDKLKATGAVSSQLCRGSAFGYCISGRSAPTREPRTMFGGGGVRRLLL